MPFFRRRYKQMTPLERARHIAIVHNAGERGDYKRPWTRPPSGRPELENPTEPCPICLEIVGLPTSQGFTEQWGSLPCGHKFGMRCLKVWLGTNKYPRCPFCKEDMFHTCGHPPLPRLTDPPKFDPSDVQPDQVPPSRQPNPIAAEPAPEPALVPVEEPVAEPAVEPAAEPEVEPAPEPEEQQEAPEEYPRAEHVENPVDEAVECNQDKASSSCQPGPGRLSPKNSVRVSAEPSIFNEPQAGPAPRENISEVVDEEPEAASPVPSPVNNEQPVVVPPPARVEPIAPAAPIAQDAPEPAQQQPAPPVAAPQPVVAPVEAPAAIPVVSDPVSHDFAPMAQPSNSNINNNNNKVRISLRHRLNILHRKRNFARNEQPVAPQPPQPITIETEQDYDTMSYMMQYYEYKMPTFMAMAYPRKVDLKVPCAYCYMKIQLPRPDPKKKHPKPTPYTRISRLPGKKCIVQSGKYAGYFGGYAWSGCRFVLRATFCRSLPPNKLNEREQQLLDAFWVSWRTAHSSKFEEWWAKQEPCTEEPRVPFVPPEEDIDLVFEVFDDL